MNEKRVFSNQQVLDRINELDVQLVVIDFTTQDDKVATDLKRAGSGNIPVNLIYPPEYPAKPAIKLNELVTPADVLFVLDYLEQQTAEQVATP